MRRLQCCRMWLQNVAGWQVSTHAVGVCGTRRNKCVTETTIAPSPHQVLDILLGDERYLAMGAHPVRVSLRGMQKAGRCMCRAA